MAVHRNRGGRYVCDVQNGIIMWIAWQSTKTGKAHGWTSRLGGVLWYEVGIVTTAVAESGLVVAAPVTWETLHTKAVVWDATLEQLVEWETLHAKAVEWED